MPPGKFGQPEKRVVSKGSQRESSAQGSNLLTPWQKRPRPSASGHRPKNNSAAAEVPLVSWAQGEGEASSSNPGIRTDPHWGIPAWTSLPKPRMDRPRPSSDQRNPGSVVAPCRKREGKAWYSVNSHGSRGPCNGHHLHRMCVQQSFPREFMQFH